MHILSRLRANLLAVLLLATLLPHAALAQAVIRDAEIESFLRDVADPIFGAAGLTPDDIQIFILQDDSLNAFVAGGQNLFLHTGLLSATDGPEELAGVIAHETGHIAGGHLTRLKDASENAATEALIGAVLGAAAAVAGAPQLGTAIMAGGASVAQSNLLKFSRSQEQSADQAAIGFLEKVELPPEGLYRFFKVLENSNLRINSEGNEFLRTHPLTRDRIQFLAGQVERSPLAGRRYPQAMIDRHARMVAKLDGFLDPPAEVLRRYDDQSMPARYARSVAYFRQSDLDSALRELDSLLAEAPDDPWLHELKGQVLFESGRVADAVAPYRLAVKGAPLAALLRVGLARALIETGGEDNIQEALIHLQEAVRLEPRYAGAWRFLGIAQGRAGNDGSAALALAEHAVLTRNRADAELYLRRAEHYLPKSGPEWLHLQDLKRLAEDIPAPTGPRRR